MIYIASDHRGFELKNYILKVLSAGGISVEDLGPNVLDKDDDYVDYAALVAKKIPENPENKGILTCANGVGMSIAANKFPGVRAALSWDPKHAASSRNDDDSNILALPSDYLTPDEACAIAIKWLRTPFGKQERFIRRINKIEKLQK